MGIGSHVTPARTRASAFSTTRSGDVPEHCWPSSSRTPAEQLDQRGSAFDHEHFCDFAGVPRAEQALADIIGTPVIYQHPLAYLLGLEGVALLRAFSGAYDREFTLARFAEIRELLESPDVFGTGVEARPISTREGYDTLGTFVRRAAEPASRDRAADRARDP